MSQHDYNIANQGFSSFRSDLNNALSAIQTTNSGTSRPTGAVAGQLWLDTTSATTPTLKYYDGADDISLATIDHSANTVNWLDSTVSITGLSTTATGTVLTLTDSVSTSTVNLIIDNQKEIRFRETTANGTNYVALKAPASLSADLTFTLPTTDGTSGQVLQTNGSGVLSFATVGSLAWQSVQTTGFTAVASRGYPCNTTSSAFTITLPASPSVGDTIQIVDYAGTFDTNAITLSPNGNKINGSTDTKVLSTEREGVSITYVDSTQGWVASSGVNEGTVALSPAPYSIDFLVIAGGGSGGTVAGGGGGAGGYRTSTQSVALGTVITITVGDGGASVTGDTVDGNAGSNSSISGSGLTTITSAGGGRGSYYATNGGNGGSGGGGGGNTPATTGGTGNTPSTSPSQGNNGGTGRQSPRREGGGGGGSSAVGVNGAPNQAGAGGAGTASSITGSSVTRAGGGGGAINENGSTNGAGGTGGGGAGGNVTTIGTSGTANTGGGGGAGGGGPSYTTSGAGGKGVVILSIPTVSYSGTITGSPTESTSGSNKILIFTGSGTYTG
jgi:hypothetical protein